MALSDNNTQVPNGDDWAQFCDTLKRCGDQILRPEAPVSELNRAEGFRYLTRLLRIGLDMHLEYADPDFPGFLVPSHETAKIGADNPDNMYLMARINPAHDYIIEGTRGTVNYLSLGSQKGGYETDGKMEQTGFIDDATLDIGPDSQFKILLSQKEQSGNWLALEQASNAVIVRQTFLDRQSEKPAQLSIRRASPDAQPEPLSGQRLKTALTNVGQFVQGTSKLFADWAQSYQPHTNELPPADQALCQSVGGDPNIYYYHSYWELAEDEALVIHLPRIPDCRFWNIQVNNYWMESLDYRYVRACINSHSAKLDADGGLTIVLAHTDPGRANWLQTAGHKNGTLCLRWVGAADPVDPTTTVKKLSELPA